MITGVCNRISQAIGIHVFWVRAVFVVAVFTWLPTLILYGLLYLHFKFLRSASSRNSSSTTSYSSSYSSSYNYAGAACKRFTRHFQGLDYTKRLYKNSAQGKIKGVCAGIADYLEINALWVRLAFVAALMFGPFSLLVYLCAVLLLNEAPYGEFTERRQARRKKSAEKKAGNDFDHQWGFEDWEAGTSSEKKTKSASSRGETFDHSAHQSHYDLTEVSEQFDGLETKLRRLEATITSKRFQMHAEFKRMGDA